MAALPPSTDFTAASVTEAGFKTALTGLRDYLSGLLGTDGTAATAKATLGISTAYVTSVSAASPVVSSGGLTPQISMPAASSGAAGYMSAAYAAKLDSVQAGATAGPVYDAGVNGLGVIAMMINNSGTVASGATIAGSSLQYFGYDLGGSVATSLGTAAGTWRNITAASVPSNTAGTFQRVA